MEGVGVTNKAIRHQPLTLSLPKPLSSSGLLHSSSHLEHLQSKNVCLRYPLFPPRPLQDTDPEVQTANCATTSFHSLTATASASSPAQSSARQVTTSAFAHMRFPPKPVKHTNPHVTSAMPPGLVLRSGKTNDWFGLFASPPDS